MAVAFCDNAKPKPVESYPEQEFRARERPNLVSIMNSQHVFGQILSILNQTGLTPQLLAEDNVTLFLPTNDALNKLPPGYLANLRANPQKLEEILSYHVVTTQVPRLYNDLEMMSMSNKPVRVNQYGTVNFYAVEGVKVTSFGQHAKNGYVYGIDGLLTPPEGDIIDIIINRPDMRTLSSLISKAGIMDRIKNDHNMTIFAPTDDAFASLNPAVLQYLEYSPNTIRDILMYHIIDRQSLYSIGWRHTMTFSTADGHNDPLMIIERGDDVWVNNAKITEKDISADNGVLHVIDDTLIPIRVTLEIENQGINLRVPRPTAAATTPAPIQI